MATARPAIPRVIVRYVFVRLLGTLDVGPHCNGDGNEINPRKFVDPFETADPPLDGLYRQRRAALRESASCSEQLADLYFDCPSCGFGPHVHLEDRPYVEHLQDERTRADKAAAKHGQEIALLRRLIDPDVMGDAYAALAPEMASDKHWYAFIEAARNARQDFSEYRRINKKAARLLSEVSTVARQLALLVADLQQTSVRLPVELQYHGKNPDALFSFAGSDEARHLQLLRFIERVQMYDKVNSEPRPDLRTTLFTVSEIARQLPVNFACPEVEAAISTRQDSKKSAYFRAFGSLLKQSEIKLSAPVKRAMAITANALMDDPNLTNSEDDVRKALARIECRKSRKVSSSNGLARKTRSRTPS